MNSPETAADQAQSAAMRLQRRYALAVMWIPALGTVAALGLAYRYGVGQIEWTTFGVMYVLTIFGVSAGFHRHFAHRAFRTHAWLRQILGALGSMAAQGPLLFWVATHRQHHALSDRPGDPHSPNLVQGSRWRGFWYGHLGWMLHAQPSSFAEYARDLMRDRAVFKIHQRYLFWALMGLVLPTVVGAIWAQSAYGALLGFLWGGLVRLLVASHVSWFVGSLCHMFGRRPFQTRDQSGNVHWVALFSFGEGLQNNHHAFPSSASHAMQWWEPDITAWVLRVFKRLGLIWDVKIPSAAARQAARQKGYDATELGLTGPLGGE